MSPHSDAGFDSVDVLPSYANFNGGDPVGPVQLNGFANGHSRTNGHTNGHTNGNGYSNTYAPTRSASSKSYLKPTDPAEVHDLVCVGFGPASLAVAVALNDNLEMGRALVPNAAPGQPPKVVFLEKQDRFAWHAGMLLPGAKMQISFIKDMASLRNPRSHFTFLNYLHLNDRLVEFTNMSTFLPARVEYEAYLRWCASHFDDVVQYQSQVVSVSPDPQPANGGVKTFTVKSRNNKTGQITSVRSRNVLIAIGGQPSIPKCLPAAHSRVIHSSQYAHLVPQILKNRDSPYRVAVVGAGQSAAEIFNNIQNLYPNSRTSLVMRSEFLKPSDDSPFVNSIFNPAFTDALFPRSRSARRALIEGAKATNYGVVRLELIEHLYEKMYDQMRDLGRDERNWPHRIMAGREIVNVEEGAESLKLHVRRLADVIGDDPSDGFGDVDELIEADLVIAATGYKRSAHIDMLKDSWGMLPRVSPVTPGAPEIVDGWEVCDGDVQSEKRKLEVTRDYRVKYRSGTVAPDAGVWLQGCCELTHGLSDTLLSVLAVRSNEIVEAIFPSPKAKGVSA